MSQFGAQKLSRGVRDILIASFAVYAVEILPAAGEYVMSYGALIPSKVGAEGQAWRLVTYMFLHDPRGPWHLVFNMLALWMFGGEIENLWGTRRFILFYIISGVCAGAVSFVMWNTPIVGASGAVLALLTVYAFYFPDRQVLMFFIFPMPVRIAVMIIGFISLAGSMSSAGGIAHLTHLGGIAVAIIYLKAQPLVCRFMTGAGVFRAQPRGSTDDGHVGARGRYFEEVIDPILQKISLHGVESLTAREREILRRASNGARRTVKDRKIIPFDFSRH